MEAAKKILDYLKSKGISQAYVSRKTGISYSKLSLVLTGRRRLSIEDYELICGALDVPAGSFIQPRLPDERR